MRRLQPNEGWVIAVMTRFHENDLASHYIRLAEADAGWIVLRTPMVATNDPDPDPLGRATGELLWPERFGPAYIKAEQADMSIAEWNLVFQCDPTGMGGDIFQSEAHFQPLPANFWSEIMPRCQVLQFWDLAFSEQKTKKTCFTVAITVAVDPDLNIYILHLLRGRFGLNEAEDEMVKIISITKPLVVGIETDKFHQTAIISMVKRVLGRVMANIQLVRPKDDKISRARLPAGRAQAGKVFINKQAPWYRTFVSEALAFPNSKYKDQVDALSGVTLLVEHIGDVIRTSKRMEVVTSMAS
jgi:predicted phage terminase large subunit-like protein